MRNSYKSLLVNRFKGMETVSREDLYNFYLQYEPDLSEGTLGWRIYDLKQKNVITAVGRGLYTFSQKLEHQPNISKKAKKIAKLFIKDYSDADYCISETSWLNEFTVQQTYASFIVLETEKDLLNSVFFKLNERIKDVFLQPGENEVEIYVLDKENPVILKPLITRSPIRTDKTENISTPTLEKMLTDIYCDRHLYFFYSGFELENIFENAFKTYAIDFSRLFNYAERRGRELEIKEFITRKINYSVGGIVK